MCRDSQRGKLERRVTPSTEEVSVHRDPKPETILKKGSRGTTAAVIAAALLSAPAMADETALSGPIQAGSLHDGPLDMVLYYVPVAGDLLEVTGTYAPKDGGEARRFVMVLSEGDAVAFAMPGHRQARYRFARRGTTVTASVEPAGLAELARKEP
jgi:hypothetical protein